jgi:NCAIR mutase (PurE)-related protein
MRELNDSDLLRAIVAAACMAGALVMVIAGLIFW